MPAQENLSASAMHVTAASRGLALCKSCHRLQPCPARGYVRCTRCGEMVFVRKPYSLALSGFFLALALLLLIPANMLPIMNILLFNRGEPSTIIGGVALLWHHEMYAIAAIVFVASFVVPLGKAISIIVLLLSVYFRWPMNTHRRIAVYRIVEFLGRWSMLDIFVVAVMVGLVQLGQTAAVVPGMGATAFGAAVIFTMLSSMSFDPRLIWDAAEQAH
ncbi:MAG: paraquat-inducible protein A [Pseudomonadales bacterium]